MLQKNMSCFLPVLSFFIFAVLHYSCAAGTYLKTEKVPGIEGEGSFSVILYGSEYLNNPLRAAILDVEGDQYTFKLRASEYEYTVKSGVPVKEALNNAQLFISRHSNYLSSRLKKVLDNDGGIIGYELRPLYLSSAFGLGDILNVRYRTDGNNVIVSIDMKRTFKKKNLETDDYH